MSNCSLTCPKCHETFEHNKLVFAHFIIKHPFHYIQLKRRGINVLISSVPGADETFLVDKLKLDQEKSLKVIPTVLPNPKPHPTEENSETSLILPESKNFKNDCPCEEKNRKVISLGSDISQDDSGACNLALNEERKRHSSESSLDSAASKPFTSDPLPVQSLSTEQNDAIIFESGTAASVSNTDKSVIIDDIYPSKSDDALNFVSISSGNNKRDELDDDLFEISEEIRDTKKITEKVLKETDDGKRKKRKSSHSASRSSDCKSSRLHNSSSDRRLNGKSESLTLAIPCLSCHKSFSHVDAVLEHEFKEHKDLKRYFCPFCKSNSHRYANIQDLERHIKERHNTNIPFKVNCWMCSVPYNDMKSFLSHVRVEYFNRRKIHYYRIFTSQTSPIIQCNECRKNFSSETRWINHLGSCAVAAKAVYALELRRTGCHHLRICCKYFPACTNRMYPETEKCSFAHAVCKYNPVCRNVRICPWHHLGQNQGKRCTTCSK